MLPLLRLRAERRWGGRREGWAGSIHSPENKRSHFQAGSRLGAQRTLGSRGGGPIPPPSAPSRPAPPSTMEPGWRPALHSRLLLFPPLFGAPQVWGCRRRRMNESESQAPRCPRHPLSAPGRAERRRWTELKSRRAANPASGAGKRGSKPRESRCSSAPTRAPRLSRSAPPPRAASQSPGPPPPPHTSITRPPPPASSSRSAEQRRPRRPEARRCLRLHRQLAERRAQLPGSAPPAWAERGGKAGCGGRGRRRGEPRARAVPPPAGGRGREAAAAAEQGVGAGGWVADPSRGPAGALRAMGEKAAAARAAGRLVVRGRIGPCGELIQPAGPSVRPSFLPPHP